MTFDIAAFHIAVAADAEAIAQLVNAAYRTTAGWTNETELLSGTRASAADVAATIADASTTVLVARSGDAAVTGCIAIELDGKACLLSMLAVDPARQTAGLGAQLLAAAEQFAAGRGAAIASMTVIRQREQLVAWYERRGYQSTGALEPFPYGDLSVGTPLRDDLQFVVLEKMLGP
jgi:GNAT superfamily N-acetyltransferase